MPCSRQGNQVRIYNKSFGDFISTNYSLFIGGVIRVIMASGCAITRSVAFISLLYFLLLLHRQRNIKQEVNVYGSFWLNSESTTTSNAFLCEFSLVLDAKLNRRHIVFTDGNLPHRRRYLALKICYYNNSDASYQLLRLVLSGDTGVSLNPGPAEYTYNDDGEQPTQSSQSSIHACNGNSFLELPYKCLNICHYNICSLTNKLDEIKLLLSSFSNQRKDRPNLILGIAETFLNDSWSDASLAVEKYTLPAPIDWPTEEVVYLCMFPHICLYQEGVTSNCLESKQFGLSFAIQDQDRVYFRLSTDLLLLMLCSLSGWT